MKSKLKGLEKVFSVNVQISRILFATFTLFMAEGLSAKAINSEQIEHIKEHIEQIQHSFKQKIDTLESRLKITIEAERRNKDKTQSIAGSGYEHFYHQFKEKNERIKELTKHHSKNMQDNAQKAKNIASTHNLSSEFSAFEANIQKHSNAFLDKIKQKRAEINSAQKPKEKSIYKEKTQYILAEFENEHLDLLSDSYNAFLKKLEEISN